MSKIIDGVIETEARKPYSEARGVAGSVAHAVAAALKRHGVEVIFGQSIPPALFMATPDFNIEQVGYRTENAGGAMADGYARITGKVAVVAAQNGPAATLLVAPLAEAMKASVPIVALVQEVARSTVDKNAFQEFDHFGLFQSCTKWVKRLDQASRVDDYVDMAFAAAASGRPGPVALLLPMDVLLEPAVQGSTRAANLGSFPLDRYAPGPVEIKNAVDLLVSAERPFLVAGGGVHLSGATDELAELVDLLGIPAATTNMGKGSLDEDHALSVGMVGNCMGVGTMGNDLQGLVQEADLVLLVGTRTNQNGTDNWRLLPKGAKFIHLDIDPIEIGRNYEACRLLGDIKLTLELLCAEVRERNVPLTTSRRDQVARQIAASRAAFRANLEKPRTDLKGSVRPEALMRELDMLLAPDDVVVADASYATNWTTIYLTAKKAGMRFLSPRGLAGLGWGLPMALGAKVARPDSKVFAIVGDGGFGHCWSELETARRMKLNVVTIVLNNGILGYQAHAENAQFGDHSDACEFQPVDHAAIAAACGCHAERVACLDDIRPALLRATASNLPALIEIMTDAAAHPPFSFFEGRTPWTFRHDES